MKNFKFMKYTGLDSLEEFIESLKFDSDFKNLAISARPGHSIKETIDQFVEKKGINIFKDNIAFFGIDEVILKPSLVRAAKEKKDTYCVIDGFDTASRSTICQTLAFIDDVNRLRGPVHFIIIGSDNIEEFLK